VTPLPACPPRAGALLLIAVALAPLGCRPGGEGAPPSDRVGASGEAVAGGTESSRADQPPVALNPDPPVEYPAALLDQRIEGRVLLRLYADSTGAVVAESTRVAESSGYPAFDSAAVAGAARLRFSPALRGGRPVATAFLQPVHFRGPSGGSKTP
jgi:TonB family protein